MLEERVMFRLYHRKPCDVLDNYLDPQNNFDFSRPQSDSLELHGDDLKALLESSVRNDQNRWSYSRQTHYSKKIIIRHIIQKRNVA